MSICGIIGGAVTGVVVYKILVKEKKKYKKPKMFKVKKIKLKGGII